MYIIRILIMKFWPILMYINISSSNIGWVMWNYSYKANLSKKLLKSLWSYSDHRSGWFSKIFLTILDDFLLFFFQNNFNSNWNSCVRLCAETLWKVDFKKLRIWHPIMICSSVLWVKAYSNVCIYETFRQTQHLEDTCLYSSLLP